MKNIDYFNLQKAIEAITSFNSIKSEYILKRNLDVLVPFVSIFTEIEKKIYTENVIDLERKKKDMTEQEINSFISSHKKEFDVFIEKKKEFNDLLLEEAINPPELIKISIEDIPDEISESQSQALFMIVDL